MAPIRYGICLVGLSHVGKRSLIFELTGNSGDKVVHKCKFGDIFYELHITVYDKLFGNESVIRANDGIMFVYDKSSPDSFSFVNNCQTQIKDYGEGRMPPYILVGNKSDRENEVSSSYVTNFVWKDNCKFVETSAYSGKKVDEAFKEMCLAIDSYKEWVRSKTKKTSYTFGLFDSTTSVTDTLGNMLRTK